MLHIDGMCAIIVNVPVAAAVAGIVVAAVVVAAVAVAAQLPLSSLAADHWRR